MKQFSTAVILLFLLCKAHTQPRFAVSVQAFSSNYGGCWDVSTIIGTPNVDPNGCGDKCNSWASSSADGQREYVELVFAGPAKRINKIRVWENNAPGAIDTIYAWNPTSSSWVIVMQRTAIGTTCIFPNPTGYEFPLTSFNVDRIRISQNSQVVGGWNEIDAVNIDSVGNGGSIGTDHQVCTTNGVPSLLTNIDSAFIGSSGVVYQWQDSVAAGSWQTLASANIASYQPAAIMQTTWYRRKATLGLDSVFSNTVRVIYLSSGNPSVVPLNSWNFYGFNGGDINLNGSVYTGFYNRPDLNINTGNDWDGNGSPSSAAGYIGCTVNNDNFILVAKRKGFPTNPYTLQLPSYDDWLQVYKNGTQVFFNGGGSAIVSLGQLSATDTIEIRLQEYGGGANFVANFSVTPLTGGTIGANQDLCLGDIPAVLNNNQGAFGGDSPGTIAYQWQDSTAGGSWQNIGMETNPTYQPPTLTVNHWYRRKASDIMGGLAYSNMVLLTVAAPAGDPTVLPVNAWNFYTYNANNFNFDPGVYRGFYTLNTQGFDTRNQWPSGGSPSTTTGWQGCPVPVDNFSMNIRRKGFTDGPYIANISGDDAHVVYKNGVMMYSAGCCSYVPNISLGRLTPSDTIEIRLAEYGGQAYVQFDLQQQALSPGTVSGSQSVCGSDIPAQLTNTQAAFGGFNPTFTYQWQDSTASGAWANIIGSNTTSYTPVPISQTTWFRRKVKDANNDSAYSNVLELTFTQRQGDTAQFGNNRWNVYAYIGQDAGLATNNYRGFYTDDTLNFDTRQRWDQNGTPTSATGYAGCPVGSDNFTTQYKRRGFPSGNYNLQIPSHDDGIYAYKNGRLIYSYGGCCNSNPTINVGYLNADSTIEFRLTEGGGQAYLGVNFALISSDVYDYVNTNCNQFGVINVSGNNWWDITDNTGKIVGSINPNGNNLGNVTLRMKHFGTGPANIPQNPGFIKYMARYFDWQCTAYPTANFPVPVSVRVYYKNTELDDYKTASAQPALSKTDLTVYHYNGINEDCDNNNNATPMVPRTTTAADFGATAFYLQADIPSFSEIGVSGGSQSLPITGLQLKGQLNGNVVGLKWSTLTEQNNRGFYVERSADGLRFTNIGFIAGIGNSNLPQQYHFDDIPVNAGPVVYYRIRQIDNNGTYLYSNTIPVKLSKQSPVIVYPNPVKQMLYIVTNSQPVSIKLLDAAGKMLWMKQSGGGSETINMQSLASGSYLLQLLYADGRKENRKVVKE
ncbi:MAG: T9SS type A sorting domain-containing protein [Bacteroidota bacterium]